MNRDELKRVYESGDVSKLKGLKGYEVWGLLAYAFQDGYEKGRSDQLVELIAIREELKDDS